MAKYASPAARRTVPADPTLIAARAPRYETAPAWSGSRDEKWPLSVRALLFVLGAVFFWSLWLGVAWLIQRLL